MNVTSVELKKIASGIKKMVKDSAVSLKHASYLQEIAKSLGFKNWEQLVDSESKSPSLLKGTGSSSGLLDNSFGMFDLQYDAYRQGFKEQPSVFLALDSSTFCVVDTCAKRNNDGTLVLSRKVEDPKRIVLISEECFDNMKLAAPRPYLMSEYSRYLNSKGIRYEFSTLPKFDKHMLLDEAARALGFSLTPAEKGLLMEGVVYAMDLFEEWFKPIPNPEFNPGVEAGEYISDPEFVDDFLWGIDLKAEVFEMHNKNPGTVWTWIEDDYGNMCIQNGFRHVNREGFFVTEVPFIEDYLAFWDDDTIAMAIDDAVSGEELDE